MFKKDDKTYYDWIDYGYDMKQVKDFEFDHVVGIYRGSLPMAVHISNVFEVPMSIVGFQTRDGKDNEPYMIHKTGEAPKQVLVVDDIYDSGYTMKKVIESLSHYRWISSTYPTEAYSIQGFCLFGKENKLNVSYANEHDGSWIVFPWETLNEPV
jgi:hypoxanthine phosphoribosyltransferase